MTAQRKIVYKNHFEKRTRDGSWLMDYYGTLSRLFSSSIFNAKGKRYGITVLSFNG